MKALLVDDDKVTLKLENMILSDVSGIEEVVQVYASGYLLKPLIKEEVEALLEHMQ